MHSVTQLIFDSRKNRDGNSEIIEEHFCGVKSETALSVVHHRDGKLSVDRQLEAQHVFPCEPKVQDSHLHSVCVSRSVGGVWIRVLPWPHLVGEEDGHFTRLRDGRVQHGRMDAGQTSHPGCAKRSVQDRRHRSNFLLVCFCLTVFQFMFLDILQHSFCKTLIIKKCHPYLTLKNPQGGAESLFLSLPVPQMSHEAPDHGILEVN